jgi:hypothetical protein
MKERPILFSGPMVRAILDGKKTQTRRILKGSTECKGPYNPAYMEAHKGDKGWRDICPHGKVGDRLWVRETHMIESNFNIDSNEGYPPPFKDGRPINWVTDHQYGDYWEQCHYAASDEKPELCRDDDGLLGWRPSIHMPRWASRITLEVTDVRVQRLRDISHDDAIAEGFGSHLSVPDDKAPHGRTWGRLGFSQLWDSINGKTHPWESNPWVWALTFKRIEVTQ